MIKKLTFADSILHFDIDEATFEDIRKQVEERMNVLHEEIKQMHLLQDHEQSIFQRFLIQKCTTCLPFVAARAVGFAHLICSTGISKYKSVNCTHVAVK